MNISPINDKTPACYGIMCPQHGLCARYDAVETTLADHTISTCSTGGDERPLFIAIELEQPS